MKALVRALRGALRLFVDDGKLALTVICLLLAVGILTRAGALDGSLALGLLVAGTIAALLANVVRSAATTRR
jgi:hypothetical protein